jgi:outer membrane biosynthesis protein TonB
MARILIAKIVGYLIATIAAVSSYGHQVDLLARADLDPLFGIIPSEWITPATVDSLAIIALIVRTSPEATKAMKRAALMPLILAGGLSIAANVATAHNVIQVIVGIWTVLAYMIAELFVSRLNSRTANAVAPTPVAASAPHTTAASAITTTAPAASPQPAAPPIHPVAPAPVPVPPPAPVVAAAPPVTPPAAAPSPVQVKQRVDARQQTGTSSTRPAASTTDTSVTASDAAAPKSTVTPGQLAKARHVAEAHHKATGSAITAGELAVRLRLSTERAQHLLAALDHKSASGDATRVAASNGSPVRSSTR